MRYFCAFFFFFNDTATTEIYTLSLHDALPISREGEILLLERPVLLRPLVDRAGEGRLEAGEVRPAFVRVDVVDERRSEEHTSELQSRLHLVCRLLLEKKKK